MSFEKLTGVLILSGNKGLHRKRQDRPVKFMFDLLHGVPLRTEGI
jgi:hypothetical protein